MLDILIFGTGVSADIILEHYIDLSKVRILAFVNSDNAYKHEFRGYKVIPLTAMSDYSYDYVLIAADAYNSIRKQCIENGVPSEKIIGTVYHSCTGFPDIVDRANKEIKKMLGLSITDKLFKRDLPGIEGSYFLIGNELLLDKHCISKIPASIDPVRLNTLHALTREIAFNDVKGNVAELGVFRGDFASLINRFFPDKVLYLFDTFEGFSSQDIEFDVSKNYSNPASLFVDTSIELVLSKMPYKEMCKVVKGRFPESALNIDDTFSLVSIDTDLYLPTYNGLEFFFDKLSKNGYILVHDFNHKYYSGVRDAVIQFCRERGIGYCPVADSAGTAIITK
jgi:hypothetical protein